MATKKKATRSKAARNPSRRSVEHPRSQQSPVPSAHPTPSNVTPWDSTEWTEVLALKIAQLGSRANFTRDGVLEWAPTGPNDPDALLAVARVLKALALALADGDGGALAKLATPARQYLQHPKTRRKNLDSRGQPVAVGARQSRRVHVGGDLSKSRADVVRELVDHIERSLACNDDSDAIAQTIVGVVMGEPSELKEAFLRAKLDPMHLHSRSVQRAMAHAIEMSRTEEHGEAPAALAPRVVRRALAAAGYVPAASKSLFDFDRKKKKRLDA